LKTLLQGNKDTFIDDFMVKATSIFINLKFIHSLKLIIQKLFFIVYFFNNSRNENKVIVVGLSLSNEFPSVYILLRRDILPAR